LPKRVCRQCGDPVLVKHLAETRKDYPSGNLSYLCVTCSKQQIAELVAANRLRMGLDEA
jgi:DNA-directed RNA polymerase subunit RPC12/RpoP